MVNQEPRPEDRQKLRTLGGIAAAAATAGFLGGRKSVDTSSQLADPTAQVEHWKVIADARGRAADALKAQNDDFRTRMRLLKQEVESLHDQNMNQSDIIHWLEEELRKFDEFLVDENPEKSI